MHSIAHFSSIPMDNFVREIPRDKHRRGLSDLSLLIDSSHLAAVHICNVLSILFLSFLSWLQFTLYPADSLYLFVLMYNTICNCDYHPHTQVVEAFFSFFY